MSEFKIGDRVRVKDIEIGTEAKHFDNCGSPATDHFVELMKPFIGMKFKIKQMLGEWVIPDITSWRFSPDWLELVERCENNNECEKPPLGLTPEHVHLESVSQERINDILSAMERYSAVNKPIPTEWISELRKRVDALYATKEG